MLKINACYKVAFKWNIGERAQQRFRLVNNNFIYTLVFAVLFLNLNCSDLMVAIHILYFIIDIKGIFHFVKSEKD